MRGLFVLLRLLAFVGLAEIAYTFTANGFPTLSGMRTNLPSTGYATRQHSNLLLTMKSRRDKGVSMNLKRDKTAANFKQESGADFEGEDYDDSEVTAPTNVVRPDIDHRTQITLTEYMNAVCKANKHLRGLGKPLGGMQKGCQEIASIITRASITGLLGYANGGGSMNVQGEEQKTLDVLTNEVLKKALTKTGTVGIIASEEEDHPYFHKDTYKIPGGGARSRRRAVPAHFTDKFVTVFDPLDGSSNIDCNIPVGTIFGMYKEKEKMDNCQLDDDIHGNCLLNTLRPGKALVASGYCLYSSSCIFVFTVGAGTQGFTLDPDRKEFVLTHPDIQIPKRGRIYSFNEANRWLWDKPLQDYITALQTGNNEEKAKYSSRYVGSMVGDIHRTLLYGGIYGYPADSNYLDGKLRLLYEAAPMSFILEQAGGLALSGLSRVMDIRPVDIHQRVPFLAGSADDVMEMRRFYEASGDAALIARCVERLEGKPRGSSLLTRDPAVPPTPAPPTDP